MTIYRGASVPGSGKKTEAAAEDITIDDAGAYYDSDNVEDALQEAAADTKSVESDLALHEIDYTNPHQVTATQVGLGNVANVDTTDAANVNITDSGGYYTSTDVEGALQEVPGLISASSLDYFVEARDAASPNDTVPVHSWEATGTETDIDVALVPKGTGAITAQIADGTTAGGSKRGAYSVDLQRVRTSYGYVASGDYSGILWGADNQAAGDYSCAGGYRSAANQAYTFAHGHRAFSYVTNHHTQGAGIFSSNGDAQAGTIVLRKETTDATATILTSDAGAPSVSSAPSNVFIVYPWGGDAAAISADVIAFEPSTGVTKVWKVSGVAKYFSGTTSLVGTPTKTVIAEDTGASAWDCDLVVNATRDSAEIEVTGEAAKTIHWVCKFDTVEVG